MSNGLPLLISLCLCSFITISKNQRGRKIVLSVSCLRCVLPIHPEYHPGCDTPGSDPVSGSLPKTNGVCLGSLPVLPLSFKLEFHQLVLFNLANRDMRWNPDLVCISTWEMCGYVQDRKDHHQPGMKDSKFSQVVA